MKQIHEDYFLTDTGVVYSNKGKTLRARKPSINHNGYHILAMRVDGRYVSTFIHVLVAETFIGPRPTKRHEVNHINENKLDNRVENLEWVTRSENMLKYYENNPKPRRA